MSQAHNRVWCLVVADLLLVFLDWEMAVVCWWLMARGFFCVKYDLRCSLMILPLLFLVCKKCSFRKIKKNLLNSFLWVVFLTNVWQTMHVNTIWYLWISCEEMDSSQFYMLFIGKMGGKYNFVKMPGYLKLTILWCCKFISFFLISSTSLMLELSSSEEFLKSSNFR